MALNAQDLRTKSADELAKMAIDLRKEQMEKRFSMAGGQLENTAEMRTIRRDLARIKTVANELANGKVASAAPAKKETKKAAPAKKTAAAKKTTKAPAKKAAAKTTKGDA